MYGSTIIVLVVGLMTGLAQGQTAPVAEKELKDLEQRIGDLSVKKDRRALERIYGDDYYCIHSNGVAMNKSQDIASTLSSDVAWSEYKYSDMKVRIYGDVGVLTGRLFLRGRARGFKSGARLFTDIFVRRGGQWQLVGCQSTLAATGT